MLGPIVNFAAILAGSLVGVLFGKKIKERYTDALLVGLALVSGLVGIMSAIKTENTLCVIICISLGTLIGELLRIDDRIEALGETIQSKLIRGAGSSSFSQGFVSCSILFCIGSMAVMGSIESGINGDHSILFAKSVIDCIASVAYAAAMGIGVAASSVCVLICEGGMALLAGWVSPLLTDAVVNEVSAVGGVLLMGLAVNLLGLRHDRIRIANMLPAVFLPIAYIPLVELIGGLFK